MNADRLAAHLQVDRYGDFFLTDAVRPALHLPITPREGFRVGRHRDEELGLSIPMLTAAVSRERLFDVFLDLLTPLGEVVDVVLETSHGQKPGQHNDLRRSDIDRPVLMSHFCEFEQLLSNDGCTGVAVLSPRRRMEVQFDEHKLLVVYARDLKPFRRILKRNGVLRDVTMQFLSEAEHLHSSTPEYEAEFQNLCYRLGVGDMRLVMSDSDEW